METNVRNANHAYLSNKEVKELLAKSQAGDTTARDTLVNSNIRLVWSVVQRF